MKYLFLFFRVFAWVCLLRLYFLLILNHKNSIFAFGLVKLINLLSISFILRELNSLLILFFCLPSEIFLNIKFIVLFLFVSEKSVTKYPASQKRVFFKV